jgi:ribosome biogenesis GTPase
MGSFIMDRLMRMEELGYNPDLEKFRIDNDLEGFETGRVIAEHRERYMIWSREGEHEAEITGNLRFSAESREDFPAVGDWVAVTVYPSGPAMIYRVLPRSSVIRRQATGKSGEVQVIAANIDYSFVVQAVDNDFNLNRLERYLTICHASNVSPIILLTKTDLIDKHRIAELLKHVGDRIKDIPVIPVSNESYDGIDRIKRILEKGKSYCMLGSSGAGKSTLINKLAGREVMRTGTISGSTGKGKHTTSHRELILLENGAIIIDNPGMREVGIADTTGGLETTFDAIMRLSQNCMFKDCTHTGEKGCSVIEAVENGEIERASYENYLKMEREKAFFESSTAERRKEDRKFGKILKNYKKEMDRNR